MQGISLQYIYNLAPRLKPLGVLPKEDPVKYSTVWWTLYTGQQALYELYGTHSLYGPYLRSSAHLAEALLREINPVLEEKDFERETKPFELFGISHAFELSNCRLLVASMLCGSPRASYAGITRPSQEVNLGQSKEIYLFTSTSWQVVPMRMRKW